MKNRMIAGIEFEDFLVRMEEFHGYRSPGILVGGLMLDRALKELGAPRYLNVVCETIVCLPDAVQLLTPCTVGNGFLQILDWGKFAITAYDRESLSGVRSWLNIDGISDFPLIRGWFERTGRPREKPPFAELAGEILNAGDEIIRHRSVKLLQALKDTKPVMTGRCDGCGESYALHLGRTCPACSGDAYYIASGHRF